MLAGTSVLALDTCQSYLHSQRVGALIFMFYFQDDRNKEAGRETPTLKRFKLNASSLQARENVPVGLC